MNTFLRPRGFTLVELLITIAIIGVLATIGIPTYKKMMQKSKTAEAKALLGGLYTAESAFFSEFNGYGSMLEKIGFEVAGDGRSYSVGFPNSNCTSRTPPRPLKTSGVGAAINQVFPDYYPGIANQIITVFKREGMQRCRVGTVDDNGASFLAAATGVIAPGVPVDQAGNITNGNFDVWEINQSRELINVFSGVQ